MLKEHPGITRGPYFLSLLHQRPNSPIAQKSGFPVVGKPLFSYAQRPSSCAR